MNCSIKLYKNFTGLSIHFLEAYYRIFQSIKKLTKIPSPEVAILTADVWSLERLIQTVILTSRTSTLYSF